MKTHLRTRGPAQEQRGVRIPAPLWGAEVTWGAGARSGHLSAPSGLCACSTAFTAALNPLRPQPAGAGTRC